MTTPTDPSTTTEPGAAPVRPGVRPRCGPDTPQGTGEMGAAPVPPPFGGAALNEPSTGHTTRCGPKRVPDRRCRACGCTDNNACQNFLTGPCWWVEDDLCSECRPHGVAS